LEILGVFAALTVPTEKGTALLEVPAVLATSGSAAGSSVTSGVVQFRFQPQPGNQSLCHWKRRALQPTH